MKFPRTKALIEFLLLLILAQYTAVAQANENKPGGEMTFLTWSEYLDPEVVRQFEKEYSAKINFVYFEGNDERDRMLADTQGNGYDLVMLNDPVVNAYFTLGWLEPLALDEIPNLKYINKRWETPVEKARGYTTPYFWGTTGIAYRKDLVPYKITSWKQYFQPGEVLKGKISVMEDAMDVTSMALKALGYSANSTDENEHKSLESLLQQQKPFVNRYEYISLGEESALVSGDIWITMAYNGDALMVKQHNDNIEYVVPEEGGNLWVDYLVILKNAANKPLAKAFIDFLNRPQIAAQNAQFVYYPSPNTAGEALLPKAQLEDKSIYPDKTVLDKSEFYDLLPPRTIKRRNTIFSHVMR